LKKVRTNEAAMNPNVGKRTLDDAVDSLGLGFGQYVVVLLGGEVYSGLVKTMVTACAVSFANDLGFSTFYRALTVSVLFIGNFIGNLTSGALSDFCGRRPTILLGYIIASCSLFGTVQVSEKNTAIALRFGLGLAAGLTGPVCWTLLAEISPAKDRHWMHTLGHLTWFVGSISMNIIVHVADPSMKDVPWRQFTLLIFVIVFLSMLASFHFVLESPFFLCLQGKQEEAVANLEVIQLRNGAQGDVQNFEVRRAEVQVKEQSCSMSYFSLFDRTSFFTMTTLALCTFTLNYSSYGMMYALPMILRRSNLDVVPSMTMLGITLCGLIGLIAGIPATNYSQSRPGLLGNVLLLRSLFVGLFLAGLWHGEDDSWTVSLTLLGIFGKTALDWILYVLVYLYAVEVRPTGSRSSGSGFALGLGRLGGVVAPVIFEIIHDLAFTATVLFLGLACAGLVLVLPIETKDRQLGEVADEVTALPKLAQA
jgi:putative MFS transporter